AMIRWLPPRLAPFIDVLPRAKERFASGGTWRFLASAAAETVFSLLLAPIMWVGHPLFLARLPFHRKVAWTAQVRDDHAVPLGLAVRALWIYTAVGVGTIVVLALTHPAAIPYALPLAAGLALSIPLAVLTASRPFSETLMRLGIRRLPAETPPPGALDALALPAVAEPGAASAGAAGGGRCPPPGAGRAASPARSAPTTATAGTARRWTGSTRSSSGRTTSCSTPARTWATASPPFAGSRRGWS